MADRAGSVEVVTLGEVLAAFTAPTGAPLAEATLFERHIAGAESNVAVGVARLGHLAAFIGRIGSDGLGTAALRRLRGEGVDVSGVRLEPEATTGLLIRERRALGPSEVVYHRAGSAGSLLGPEDVEAARATIEAARWLHVTGITPALSPSAAAAVRRAVEIARAAGLTVSLDVNLRRKLWPDEAAAPAMRDLACDVDVILASLDEAQVVIGGTDDDPAHVVEAMLSLGPAVAVLKLGADGAAAIERGGRIARRPAIPVQTIVDPVGAGDAFTAGFIVARLEGFDLDRSLDMANACGAAAVAAIGDLTGLPDKSSWSGCSPATAATWSGEGPLDERTRASLMRIAVIGAGPAGLTAAHRLRAAGHEVTVLEGQAVPGGRTHSEHYGPGHWSDTGAGWLASFYPRTLALLDEIGERGRLRTISLRGGGDLRLDGRLVPNPNSVPRILTTPLLSPLEKVRFFGFMATLFATQRGRLQLDERYDDATADRVLRFAGRNATERIVRPSFEGPFFSRLEEMSGALVRSWLRDLSIGTFYQVDGGMDTPWRILGERLEVRTGASVERVAAVDGGVDVAIEGQPAGRFDGAIVAVPAPIATDIVDAADLPEAVRSIRYAPHVRLYAARRATGQARIGVHVFPNEEVATVELGTGRDGGWGRIPDAFEWALVCAPSATSAKFMAMDDETLKARLWSVASSIEPRLFDLADAEIVHLIRWPQAVPIVDRGYLGRIRTLPQRPPLVFAGDWLVQPCVEGAVRSGERAAAAFGRA